MKTFQILNIKTILFITILLTAACKQKPFEPQVEQYKEEDAAIVGLSPEQSKNAALVLGKMQKKTLGEQIQVNGALDVPPQSLVSISAPYGGFVKNTEMLPGSFVHKGELLVEIVHADYIQLQQDYLDSKNHLEISGKELERQKALKQEQVASEKTFQQAESDHKMMKNKVNALEEKLLLIGFNPKQITANGISGSVKIYAPITGYVKTVNVNIGKYVTPTDIMFEIVDTEHLHAELTVFEKDINKVEKGQKIVFTLPNDDDKKRTASVFLLGKSINADRTISIHGHLDKEDNTLLPGMYIKGYIETHNKEVLTLPDEAFVHAEEKDFVFVSLGENRYERLQVLKGLSENGFTEGIFQKKMDVEKSQFVIKGAYSLLAKMLNTEEEE